LLLKNCEDKKKSARSFSTPTKTQGGRFFQISFKILISLSEYLEKVQAGIFNFPDFSDKCPICGGNHCAVRIGYYYRWTIDIDLQNCRVVILLIPVARYLCRRVNKPKQKHKTFSLLPDILIPYNRISIDLMMYILQILIANTHIEPALEKIDSISPEDIFFSEKMIQHLLEIMEQSRIKLILFFQQHKDTERAPPKFYTFDKNDIIDFLLKYSVPDNQHPLKGAYCLSVHYYNIQGAYHKNARFLFGTASQFC
jgi:hypothetical protein